MAEKIDYKEYLKSLGKIETDAKKRIQAYLEEQIKEDAALRELYRAEKIDDCYDFIKNAVKATGCGSSATVEDAIVFKMARDFYLDILPKKSDEVSEVKEAGAETAEEAETEAETEQATEEEKPADNENSGTPCEEVLPENEKPETEVMLHQADDEGNKTSESESEAETESATEEEKPTDNENEAGKDYCGFEVFGEEDEGAETAASESAEAETEQATEEEKPADNENSTEEEPENEKPEPFIPKYDEEGNGLLFDF